MTQISSKTAEVPLHWSREWSSTGMRLVDFWEYVMHLGALMDASKRWMPIVEFEKLSLQRGEFQPNAKATNRMTPIPLLPGFLLKSSVVQHGVDVT